MKGKLILPLLAGALSLGGCDQLGTDNPAGSADAGLSILLTDAPGDFRAAVVTITDVYLQPAEGEGAERIYLRQGDGITTDLLTLQNRVQELVSDEPVPAGTYEQLRLVITGGYIEVEREDGGSSIYASSPDYEGLPTGATVGGELQMPGYSRSGLKVILSGGTSDADDGALAVSGEETLIVDFDVSQSFGKPAGRSGKWVMRPVLRAISAQRAASLSVSLSVGEGVQLPSLAGSAVTLAGFGATLTPVAGGDAKTVAFADADGAFDADFRYLLPGEYRLDLSGPAGITFETVEALPLTLTIGTGSDATAALTLSAVGT